MSEPRVLYITGWLRSGSTLLGNVLNELPGVLHVGELHYLWRNGVLKQGTNSSCGCGADLTECSVWSSALRADDTAEPAAAARMVARQQRYLRTRHTRARLADWQGGAIPSQPILETTARTAAIYRRLAEHGAERLVVDSSKYPAEAAALLGRRDVDVRILHMVRDPRPTAFSYRQAKAYIDPIGPARSSAYWTAFNAASELLGRAAPDRYLRLRHEDMCADPRAALTAVMRFAGLDGEPPIDAHGRVTLGENHSVTGNPDRLSRGSRPIKADDRWRKHLGTRAIAAASSTALPLLARYRYPLLPIT
ncbi:sulfotransferase [Pseudonocardia sp. TRM90224]|uniref:sulfotransferase n=1 Tax=Pseudonocardia sp. TRM90224 TaxID=2812678 RepID=UPI001E5205DA|nr:sulfotransferase [Pseudonocardia sp. TRM90224]